MPKYDGSEQCSQHVELDEEQDGGEATPVPMACPSSASAPLSIAASSPLVFREDVDWSEEDEDTDAAVSESVSDGSCAALADQQEDLNEDLQLVVDEELIASSHNRQ